MNSRIKLLLIGGSLRDGSVNAALLRTVRELHGDSAVIYDGLGALPHFNPDDDREPLQAAVAALRAAVKDADAILFCTPEYAGALPGAFKNLLDWLVGGTEISAKPVGWINVSTALNAASGAHAELRTVLGYVGAAVVEAACVHVPVQRQWIRDGIVEDAAVRGRIEGVLRALDAVVRARFNHG